MKISADFWRSKCVIVTGASSGIGLALAELLADQGAKVGLLARRAECLHEAATGIAARGGQAAFATADVGAGAEVAQAVATLEATLGPCDVMVANAGMYRKTPGRAWDAERARVVVNTNLFGVMHSVAAVLPGMLRRQRGHVAAVASLAGLLGLPGAAAYSASKSGVVMLMESLRADLRRQGITVTTVCPGYVDTAMITDEERATVRDLVTAAEAARHIAWAIQQGRAEYRFPWWTAWEVRLAQWLPPGLRARILSRYPEMEETATAGPTEPAENGHRHHNQ